MVCKEWGALVQQEGWNGCHRKLGHGRREQPGSWEVDRVDKAWHDTSAVEVQH